MKRIKCDLLHRITRCRIFLYRKFRGNAIAILRLWRSLSAPRPVIAFGIPDQPPRSKLPRYEVNVTISQQAAEN